MEHSRAEMEMLRGRPLRNTTCPYCGVDLKQGTKEHVVGRRFVPMGSLNNEWNLILRACGSCNAKKAELEDEVSAITMNFHLAGLHGMDDESVKREAMRKAQGSKSRTTRKAVAESAARVEFEVSLSPGLTASAKFQAPAQLADSRVYELARLQIAALFYGVTYDSIKRRGYYFKGGFFPLHGTVKSDWGNVTQRAFARQIRDWDYRLIVATANGYFRALIRRHPSAELWAWALDWNESYRVMGYFGNLESATEAAGKLPSEQMQTVFQSEESLFRFHMETPIAEGDDILFNDPREKV